MIRWKALIETKIKQKTASKNIQPFSSYSGLNFLLFAIVILLCYSHLWIIKEGIFYFENEYNIWIPRAKSDRNVKFCRSNSIISKIMRPSFLQFSVRKGTLVRKLIRNDVTSDKNGNFKPEITHEIMEILTYFFLQIFINFDGLSDSSIKIGG